MAIKIEDIRAPVQDALNTFEHKFKASIESDVPLLDRIMRYIVKRKGKQIRPLFVFLSARLHGEINDQTHIAASLIELLHTATLVHDDVVDNAYERRGFFSINALWKNKIAVLVGDYLLSKGLILSMENDTVHLLKIVTHAVKEMSEGELLQIEKARRMDIEESIYYEIIRKKTASLIASACACGAASVTSDPAVIEKMRQLGELTGMAFQIKDDLFDYGDENTGKPKGLDIQEKKMTLPLIYALQHASWYQKRKIINIIKNDYKSNDKVKTVIDFVNRSGGIEYSYKKMYEYRDKAYQIIESMPENDARDGIRKLIDFTIERTK